LVKDADPSTLLIWPALGIMANVASGSPGAEFAEHIGPILVVGSGEQQNGKLQLVDGGAEVIVL